MTRVLCLWGISKELKRHWPRDAKLRPSRETVITGTPEITSIQLILHLKSKVQGNLKRRVLSSRRVILDFLTINPELIRAQWQTQCRALRALVLKTQIMICKCSRHQPKMDSRGHRGRLSACRRLSLWVIFWILSSRDQQIIKKRRKAVVAKIEKKAVANQDKIVPLRC